MASSRATVTVPTGASGTSDAVSTKGRRLVGIQLPTGWVTSNIQFDVSFDGVTYVGAVDAAAAAIALVAAVAAKYIALKPSDAAGAIIAPCIKVISVTSQGANRTVQLIFSEV